MTTPTVYPPCRICGENPANSPDFPGVCRWESCEAEAVGDHPDDDEPDDDGDEPGAGRYRGGPYFVTDRVLS